MFFRLISTALSILVMFTIASDEVTGWVQILAWIYVIALIVFGVMALKAKQIMVWCDKQLSKQGRKHDDQ